MGKFGGKKPAASIGSGSGKPIGGWPPAKGPGGGKKKDEDDAAEDDEEESDFDDEEEEEWSGSEGSSGGLADVDGDDDDDDDGEDFEQSIKFMQQYLSDPLGAFMAAPDTHCDLATAQKIYAARAVVAADVDSKIGPSSAMADEYRRMELAHLKTLTEKLYAKRGAKAAAEVKEMSEADLAEDGTGLMWSMILDSVCESLGQKFPQDPIQFSDMESDVFNFCLNITPSYVDNDPFQGTVFTFDFAPNPFFENTQLRVAFHYAGANLSLDRVGIDVAAICGVECDTPVQFKPGHKFLSMPDALVREHERKAQKGMLETFFVSKDTTAEDKAAMERLMCMTPRPLFTSLFNTNTPAASREKIRKALVCGKDGDHSEDSSSHGLALVRAGTLELLPWKALVTGLTFVARAPMITAMDLEQGGQEMQGPGGPGGDDEEEEEEDSDDDDSAEEGGGKPAAGKKNRAEGGKAAAPQECKQQ